MTLLSFTKAVRSRSPIGDWAQEELAEIYRVLHLLQNAGVPICMDRGLTDRNEPWCVFFDPDGGNVFLHIARLDGEYLLISETLGIRVTGPNFRSATRQFEEAVGVTLKNNEERSRKVIAHPAAQLMFSLAAVILLVKAKSAVAADRATGISDDVSDADMSKLRAVISRIQDSVENPVLVAAMVGAIVLSSSSLQDLDISNLDNVKISAETARHSSNGVGAETIDVELVSSQLDDDSHTNLGTIQPEARVLHSAAEQKLLTLADTALAEAHVISVATAAADFAAHQQQQIDEQQAVGAADASPDPRSISFDVAQAESAQDGVSVGAQSSGSGAQLISSILDGLSASSNFVVDNIDVKTTLDFSGLVTIAQASAAEDVEALIQGNNKQIQLFNNETDTLSSTSLADHSSSDYEQEPLAANLREFAVDPQSMLLDIMYLFDEVDVYKYSDTQVVVVDVDVRGVGGGELAFVTGEIGDGVTISLVGSRETIDTYFQSTMA